MNFIETAILAASLMVAVPLNAQGECNCPAPDEEPYIPCGYSVDAYEMEYLRIEIETYLYEVQNYMQCLGKCFEEANLKAENIIDVWNSAVEHNSNR